jgi:PKD repeat protein
MKSKNIFFLVTIFFSALCLASAAQAFQLEVSANPTSVAIGDTVNFTCTSKGGTLPYSYTWNFDDPESYTSSTTTQNPSHTFNYLGLHEVTVTVTDNSGNSEIGILLVDVVISSSTPSVDAVKDCGCDNTGKDDNYTAIQDCIAKNYDSTHGLEIIFPSGTYKFAGHDIPGGRHTGILVDGINAKRKIILRGEYPSSRPTLKWVNTVSSGQSWNAFIFNYGMSSSNAHYILVKDLIIDNDSTVDTNRLVSDNDIITQLRYITIQNCDLKDFDHFGKLSRGRIKKNNYSGWKGEGTRGHTTVLWRYNYVHNAHSSGSHFWYCSGVPKIYIVENYLDSQNITEAGKNGAQLKNTMSDGKFNGNIIRNAPSSGLLMGKLDKEAINYEINDNRFINDSSFLYGDRGLILWGITDSDIKRNFFSEHDEHSIQAPSGSGEIDITLHDNVYGYNSPADGFKSFQCDVAGSCITNESGNINNNDKYYSGDPSGWYDENGYLDPGEWEYVPPTNCSVSLNGAGHEVTLLLSATDSGSGMESNARFPLKQGALMQFSNDGVIWSEVRPYSQSTSWTLPDGEGDKIIYARFRDRHGNWSQPASSTDGTISPPSNLKILKIYN